MAADPILLALQENNSKLSEMSKSMSGFVAHMKSGGMADLEAKKENQRQQEKENSQRRQTNFLLQELVDMAKTMKKAGEGGLGLLGILAGLLLGGAAMLLGYLTGYGKEIARFIKAFFKVDGTKWLGRLKNFLKGSFLKLVDFISDIIKNGFKTIGKLFKFDFLKGLFGGLGKALSGIGKILSFIGKGLFEYLKPIFQGIGTAFKTFFSLITAPFKLLAKGGSFIKNIFKALDSFFAPLKAILGFFFKIGKVFGKIFAFVGWIITAVQAVSKFIDTYKKTGSVVEAMKDTVAFVIADIIGLPLDLMKDVLIWFADKFGFDDLKKKLESIGSIREKIETFVKDVFEWVEKFIEDPKKTLSDTWTSIKQKLGIDKAETITDMFLIPLKSFGEWIGKKIESIIPEEWKNWSFSKFIDDMLKKADKWLSDNFKFSLPKEWINWNPMRTIDDWGASISGWLEGVFDEDEDGKKAPNSWKNWLPSDQINNYTKKVKDWFDETFTLNIDFDKLLDDYNPLNVLSKFMENLSKWFDETFSITNLLNKVRSLLLSTGLNEDVVDFIVPKPIETRSVLEGGIYGLRNDPFITGPQPQPSVINYMNNTNNQNYGPIPEPYRGSKSDESILDKIFGN